MTDRWRIRDLAILGGPLLVVLGISTLCTLGALVRRVVRR